MGFQTLHPTAQPSSRTRISPRPKDVRRVIHGRCATTPPLRKALLVPPHEQPGGGHYIQRGSHAPLRHDISREEWDRRHQQRRDGRVSQPLFQGTRRVVPVLRQRKAHARLPSQPPTSMASTYASNRVSPQTSTRKPATISIPYRPGPL